jgi:glyoxylase-like metal-dependent hydrolase (beta-lactamase superfamily II)
MRKVTTGLLLLLLAGAALAGHLEVEKISGTVFLARPAAGDPTAQSNAAFVVLPDGVLLFDTLSTPELLEELLAEIPKHTDKPLTRLVLSHWHPDHAGGLDALRKRDLRIYTAPGVPLNVTESRRAKLDFLRRIEKSTQAMARRETDPERAAELERQMGEHRKRRQQLEATPGFSGGTVVADRLEVEAGDRSLVLLHSGPGHTDGDLMLYLPSEKILLTGDLLSVGALPYMEDAVSSEWLRRLDEIASLSVEVFVPGHGPAGKVADRDQFRNYLATLRRMVEPIARTGTQMDLVNQLRVPQPYDTWTAQDLWFPNTLRVFREMRAEAP